MSNLQLSLKTKWFELTKSGAKTEDYRELSDYWIKRLILEPKSYIIGIGSTTSYYFDTIHMLNILNKKSTNYNHYLRRLPEIKFKDFTQNTMTLGYPKSGDTDRILKLEHKGIKIRTGNPNWGAEPDKLYFVILHGSAVE